MQAATVYIFNNFKSALFAFFTAALKCPDDFVTTLEDPLTLLVTCFPKHLCMLPNNNM